MRARSNTFLDSSLSGKAILQQLIISLAASASIITNPQKHDRDVSNGEEGRRPSECVGSEKAALIRGSPRDFEPPECIS